MSTASTGGVRGSDSPDASVSLLSERPQSFLWRPSRFRRLDRPGIVQNPGVALDQTLYFQQDANFNVTSITDTSGNVLERYRYTPYGERTVLNANFSVNTDPTLSDYDNSYGHQGGRASPETGLMLFRHREYHAMLGRWVQRDPAGYADSLSTYQLGVSSPTSGTDPFGLKWDFDSLSTSAEK